MCLADRRDWAVLIPSDDWTEVGGEYRAKIELGTGDYDLPFDVDSAWLAGIDNAERCLVEVRRAVGSGDLLAGTLPCPVGDLHAPLRGFGRLLFLSVSGDDLTEAPNLSLLFRTETPGC